MERAKQQTLFILIVIAASVFCVLYPRATPFISDEPMLLDSALAANASGRLASAGLIGNRGVHYGPLPVWIYQVILSITHQASAIVVIHSALFIGALAVALVWLGRSLRLWKWGMLAVLLSPYVWIYARQLWDNPFNIPLGMMCIASYAAFLDKRQAWTLMLAIGLGGLMLLVHLMAIVMPMALLLHLLLFRRDDVKKFWPHIGIALLLVGGASIGYISQVLREHNAPGLPAVPTMNRWWFALLGPRVLSGAWIDYFFPRVWLEGNGAWSTAFVVAMWISLLAFPITWLGLFSAGRAKPASQIAMLCVIALVLQLILNGITITYGHPHYYSGAFAIYAAALLIGLHRLSRFDVGWMLTIANATICGLLLSRIIQTGGTRDAHFGVTIGQQLSVLRDWARYSERSPMHIETPQIVLYPQALAILEALEPFPRRGDEPTRELIVRFMNDDPKDAHIELVEQPMR